MKDIIAIGSVTRDCFLDASGLDLEPFRKTPSGRAFRLPFGDKLEIRNMYTTIGGNAANAAVTFARQGFRTACVGEVGDDPNGWEIKRHLNAEKVSTDFLISTKRAGTAYSTLLLKNGERTILEYNGSSNLLDLKDNDLRSLKSGWWYVSLKGESMKTFGRLVAFARKNKIAVAFNPSGYHLRHDPRSILRHLRAISFLVLNEEEAALLTGIPFSREREVFKKLDALMPGILAVTNGSKGVTVSDGHSVYKAGTFKEKKLVDRTGAGDAFGSGFAASLLRSGVTLKNIERVNGVQIEKAIRAAAANATSVVEHLGATEGALTRSGLNGSRFKDLKMKIYKL